MDPHLEIRKLSPGAVAGLVNILESGESWKKLMAIIPKILKVDDFRCDVDLDNLHKYRSEHFSLLEGASIKYKRSCTEMLLDEWGTSGRVRPALGHLLYLLVKAELFRAVEYVAVQLLHQRPPKRPDKGPPALVTVDLPELPGQGDPEIAQIEKILDEIDYPSSAIEHIKMSSINTNLNYSDVNKPKVIPKIVISESPDDEVPAPAFNIPVVIQSERSVKNETSDLIKFSTKSPPNNVTNSSEIMSNQSLDSANMLPLSSLLNQSVDAVLPDLSIINNSDSTIESSCEMDPSRATSSLNNIPVLSALNLSSDQSSDAGANVPDLSQLINSSSQSNFQIPVCIQSVNLRADSGGSVPSRACTSPLPNLSLNTLLPHFTYSELELATDNFDETPLSQGGRFLGSGAFGKVYLARGLVDKPVAVKKLKLDNVDVVHVDDTITKQFRNEVEVLSKYKHENLLSLLGYSCDGSTYCLMYEYIQGGALKDRLQKQDDKLIWTVRLYIAIGTARAISYLHTAFPTPLIHRDIKTANILLDTTNKPKLCDFGLIKLLPNQNTTTATTVFGTSAYMAPEAFRGDTSVKLDTFSFGVVLLELLTSLPPLDESREGVDLMTYVEDRCEDSIRPLLDTTAGSWVANDVQFADELYKIATQCLEEKKKRPIMVEVTAQLGDLVKRCL